MSKHHVLAVVPPVVFTTKFGPDDEMKECIPPTVWEGHPLTCETCDGGGDVTADDDHYPRVQDCLDCVDGATIIDWQVPHDHEDYGPGTVPVRFSIRAVPIHDECPMYDPAEHICRETASDDPRWLWHRTPSDANACDTERDITLPDDAEPGMYAIIGTEEE